MKLYVTIIDDETGKYKSIQAPSNAVGVSFIHPETGKEIEINFLGETSVMVSTHHNALKICPLRTDVISVELA